MDKKQCDLIHVTFSFVFSESFYISSTEPSLKKTKNIYTKIKVPSSSSLLKFLLQKYKNKPTVSYKDSAAAMAEQPPRPDACSPRTDGCILGDKFPPLSSTSNYGEVSVYLKFFKFSLKL